MRTLKPFFPFEAPFPAAFKGILPMVWDEPLISAPTIRLDVVEGEKDYTVWAEIPGVAKEDIHVDVDGAIVTLSAEVPAEPSLKNEACVLRGERYHGSVTRTFTLPVEVDADATRAIYANGLLILTLPKKLGFAVHRVVVN
ncbi:MAG TPA: Hsp20/alpha crystallin family protein [Usitatibacter sp.]|nr:Hsp20/alpha crystallin family protein [Usitatibacter sp.]